MKNNELVVADIKWKLLDSSESISRVDLCQLFAYTEKCIYAEAGNARRTGFLIYPKTENFVEPFSALHYRKDFNVLYIVSYDGEYAVYCDGKVVALICDDQLFVKKTGAAGAMLGADAEEGLPYSGAKPYYLISDIDNRSFLTRLVKAVCDELPAPKPREERVKRK